jgi:hypothetical protein
MSPVASDGGRATNARWTLASGGYALAHGHLTVNNNDFTTGRTEIVLGPYRLMDTVDYMVGADEDATAVNIATAVGRLPGWSAISALHVVTVYFDQSGDDTEFKVFHYGTITNFTTITPDNGYLSLGNPSIGPPVLTP